MNDGGGRWRVSYGKRSNLIATGGQRGHSIDSRWWGWSSKISARIDVLDAKMPGSTHACTHARTHNPTNGLILCPPEGANYSMFSVGKSSLLCSPAKTLEAKGHLPESARPTFKCYKTFALVMEKTTEPELVWQWSCISRVI